MAKNRVGVQLHPQHVTYPQYIEAVRQAEAAGVDTIFNWDHFYPLSGPADGPHFEGWTLLTAMAALTARAEVGSLVTCNSYRNPNLLADMARTIDHISGGRLILGIGAGWFERDYNEYGYSFGTVGSRLKALDRDLPVIRARWAKLNPPPTRSIPVLVGGGGEKVTLRITAKYADIWNGFGPLEQFRRKNRILDEWCEKVGRNPAEVERSVTVSVAELEILDQFVEAGASHFILMMDAPWNWAAVEKMVRWRDR